MRLSIRRNPIVAVVSSLLCVLLFGGGHGGHNGGSMMMASAELYEEAFDAEVLIPISTMAEMNEEVLKSKNIWLVQFYSDDPAVVECQQLEDLMTTLGTITQGIFKVGVVRVDNENGKEIALKYKVKRIPTVFIFANDKSKPIRYKGKNTDIQDLLQQLSQNLVQTIQQRINDAGLGERPKSDSSSESSSESSGYASDEPSRVLTLTSENFDKEILKSPLASAVAFAAPWCGHCKKLRPDWEEAARKLHGEGAVLGWVDATVEEELAKKYGVQGFPTIVTFDGGNTNKRHSDAKMYNSDRSVSMIVQNMLKIVDATVSNELQILNIPEIVSHDHYEEYCGGHNRICVVAVFPHLLDTGASGRSKYLSILYETYKSAFRGSAFRFAWWEGGNHQSSLEEKLGLTFGFPAVVAISLERKAFSVMTGSFNAKSIAAFCHSITAGRKAVVPFPEGLPSIATVDVPWDGISDGEVIEEEFSLDDIMGDD